MAEHKIDNDGVKGHSYSPSVQIQDLYKNLMAKDGDRKNYRNLRYPKL